MLSKPLNNLFNWNPQLFREIKGRLKVKNVAIAISASLLCQFIVMMFFLGKLPQEYGKGVVLYNRYCVRVEVEKNIYCTAIDWSYWWLDIFKALSWIFLAVILIGGV
ncbi:MAG: ABC transporter permease, partial [Okeania sp. SIO2B9]|nr:ABC transporter permease [Okeania sp. SIO2B9]